MRNRTVRMVSALITAFAATAGAQEIPATSTIQSVGLFKNGLAVVRRTLTVPGPGTYRLDNVPTPVHGTFFIESTATITVLATLRDVDVPADGAVQDLQRDLAGRRVTVYFRDAAIPVVSGTVVAFERAGDAAASATGAVINGARTRFLVLQTPTGRSYIDETMVAHVAAEGAPGTTRQRRPVLLLTVSGTARPPVNVTVSYLTNGMAWAPSYRVDLARADRLRIEQHTVIRNELEDITDVELQLISGFPNVEFARVSSPLAPSTSWTTFFQQLNRRNAPRSDSVMVQQAIVNVGTADVPELPALPGEAGVDLHAQPIGKHTLRRGDAVALLVGAAETAYERIVEWLVPDTRDPDGRPISELNRGYQDSAGRRAQEPSWDSVRFRNPLPFPMTTAPATITSAAAFNGQSVSTFVNPGGETTLPVTKALSILTRSTEQEVQSQPREVVRIGSRDYRKVTVQGELTLENRRGQSATMVVRRQFSGDLVRADAQPKTTLREEGAYSVNRRHELTWTLSLAAGEARTLGYVYSLLVAN